MQEVALSKTAAMASSQRRADWLARGVITLTWALAVLWVGVAGDYPLNDDWAYAYSAKHLLHTGELRILDWAAPSLVAQIAWGTLFLWAFGDSFESLRISTLVLALGGGLLLYQLGRRLGLRSRLALLPALAMLLSPWYVNLAFTYMSDVPWLAVMLAMLLCSVTALQRPEGALRSRIVWLTAASVLLGVAALIRQFAVVVLPAIWFCIHQQARQRPSLRKTSERLQLLAFTLPVAVIYGVFYWWYARVHGPTIANKEVWQRILELRGWQQAFHGFAIVFYAGFWLVPLAVGIGWRRLRTLVDPRHALITALLLGAFAAGVAGAGLLSSNPTSQAGTSMRSTMPYLGNVFYLFGLGPPTLNPEAYEGSEPMPHRMLWLGPLLTVLSLLTAACFSSVVLSPLQQVSRAVLSLVLPARVTPPATSPPSNPESLHALDRRALLIGVMACYLGWHVFTSPFIFDRYLLPVLPLVWLLVLCELPPGVVRLAPTLAVIAVTGLCSLALTREYLSWNAARQHAVQDLLENGANQDEIDAGFEINGTWRFIDYVKRTGRIEDRRYVWWAPKRRYAMSFWPAQPPCQTLSRYPYWAWPADAARAIHVLSCPPDSEWPTPARRWQLHLDRERLRKQKKLRIGAISESSWVLSAHRGPASALEW